MKTSILSSVTVIAVVTGVSFFGVHYLTSDPLESSGQESDQKSVQLNPKTTNGKSAKPRLSKSKSMVIGMDTSPSMDVYRSNGAYAHADVEDADSDIGVEPDEDDFVVEPTLDEEDEPYFPPTVVGESLAEHLVLSEGLGPDAEEHYQKSLERLREYPGEAIELLSTAYMNAKEDAYLDRWKMVDTAGAIVTDEALNFLTETAQSEVPEEHFPGVHGFSSKSEELMIRHAAINGLKVLAENGNIQAEQTILNLVNAKEENVREGAVLTYLALGGDREEKQQQLERVLRTEDHWMLELKQVAETTGGGEVQAAVSVEAETVVKNDPKDKGTEGSLPPEGMHFEVEI